jgi:hypothetical protein
MKAQFVIFGLLLAICFGCQKSEKTVTLFMRNKSGHPVHFWISSSKGYQNTFSDSYDTEVVPGGSLPWRADYPTIDPSGLRTGQLMIWEGSIPIGYEDQIFEFTDQSGTLTYDFRESLIGNFTFDCQLIELLPSNQSNLILADTVSGSVAKGLFSNQLNIEIDSFYHGVAVFEAYPTHFKFSDENIGSIIATSPDEILIRTTYGTNTQLLQKICRGKRN